MYPPEQIKHYKHLKTVDCACDDFCNGSNMYLLARLNMQDLNFRMPWDSPS